MIQMHVPKTFSPGLAVILGEINDISLQIGKLS